MYNDTLEYRISQYLDGALSREERSALEQQLAADPEAQRLLEEYRSLDAMVRADGALPDVDWAAFSDQISAHIDQNVEPHAPATLKLPVGRWAWIGRMAVAAALLLGIGIFARMIIETGTGPLDAPDGRVAVLEVDVARMDASAGEAVVSIDFGPSATVARGRTDRYAMDGLVTAPTRIQIASAAVPPADGAHLPF